MGFVRLILAISVVIAHSQPFLGEIYLVGGLVSVQVFFIISGFYMAMVLDKKYNIRGGYRLFIGNRFLKLFPMYWVVLLLTVAICAVSFEVTGNAYKLAPYLKYLNVQPLETLFFEIATNVLLFAQDVVMFLGLNQENGSMYFTHDFRKVSQPLFHFLLVPQAWSLGIELVFYLIAPFIVRKHAGLIVLFILLSCLLRIFIYKYMGYTNDPWTYRLFPTELALFLFGVLAFRLYKTRIFQHHWNSNFIKAFLLVVYVLILFFYQDVAHFYTQFGFVSYHWTFYLYTALMLPFIFECTKSLTWDRWIGELSYPVYISHILVIMIVRDMAKVDNYWSEISLLLTLLFSLLLVVYVSSPIEKIRQKRVL